MHAIYDLVTNEIVADSVSGSSSVVWPDGAVTLCAENGHKHGGRWLVVPIAYEANEAPSPLHTLASEQMAYVGGAAIITKTWTPPSLAAALNHQVRKINELGYLVETGGIALGGKTINTSRESQAMITGARGAAARMPHAVFDFKLDSSWVSLSASEVVAIADAVVSHVQACFTARRQKETALMLLGTVDEVLAFDLLSGWPSTARSIA